MIIQMILKLMETNFMEMIGKALLKLIQKLLIKSLKTLFLQITISAYLTPILKKMIMLTQLLQRNKDSNFI